MRGVIAKLATGRGLAALFLGYVIVFGAILMTLSQLSGVSGGKGILDFEVGYDAARVAEVFGSYGEQGLVLYRRIQLLDLLNPALYSLFAAAVTYWVWRGRGPDGLFLVPLLGGVGDYAENVTLHMLSRRFPEVDEGLVAVSSALNLIKYGLLALAFLPLIAGLVLWVLGRRGTV